MQRREFIAGVGSAAAWPVVARGQQAMPVIGYLDAGRSERDVTLLRPFHRGLSEIGYFEGRNLAVEYRWADGHYDRLPAMAADLVRRQVTVITARAIGAALAAEAATRTVPIVFNVGPHVVWRQPAQHVPASCLLRA